MLPELPIPWSSCSNALALFPHNVARSRMHMNSLFNWKWLFRYVNLQPPLPLKVIHFYLATNGYFIVHGVSTNNPINSMKKPLYSFRGRGAEICIWTNSSAVEEMFPLILSYIVLCLWYTVVFFLYIVALISRNWFYFIHSCQQISCWRVEVFLD